MKRYLLIKDWESKRHGKTIIRGTYVVITMENELTELIEGEYIEAPKEKKKIRVKGKPTTGKEVRKKKGGEFSWNDYFETGNLYE